MSFYDNFKKEWLGRSVDYDHVYAKQCVDLIEQYCHELGVNGVYGNAIDYANHPSPAFAQNFQRVFTPQTGDIVVLNGLAGNPYGHIGIVDTDVTKFLEQNALGTNDGLGRNAIGVYRAIPTARVAGYFRLRANTPPPPPPPAKRSTVFLPSSAGDWHLYNLGYPLNYSVPGAVKGILQPQKFPPGLTYQIQGWVGDYGVVITTQYFGQGTIYVKGTSAVIK